LTKKDGEEDEAEDPNDYFEAQTVDGI